MLGFFNTGCAKNDSEIVLSTDELSEAEDTEDKADTAPTTAADSDAAATNQAAQTPVVQNKNIYVDICGAVANPGVYELEPDSRVFQVVEAAGGFLPEAAASSVNQAQTVSDGQQIYVPTEQEVLDGSYTAQSGTQAAGASMDTSSDDEKVNINTADADTLKTLSGIGDAKALAIIAYRDENGAFGSIEDIMQVPGIKESTYASIKDKIVVQ